MNPTSHESPGLNLPPPVAEQNPQGVPMNPEQQANGVPEIAGMNAMPSVAEASGAAAQAFPLSLPLAPGAPVNDASTTTAGVVPLTTDKDLIDKDIVDKAKAIIEKNKNDPHLQSEEITVFKADHLYKSYNRKIKTK